MADEYVPERGHCDRSCFNEGDNPFITCNSETGECTVGDCFQGNFKVPQGTEIKTLLKGASNSPWVKLWFESNCCTAPNVPPGCNPDLDCIPTNDTLITTGNISQPGSNERCTAAIQAFQYSWGAVNAGNTCKITIHDEAGGSFNQWFKRLARNPVGASLNTGQGVYKMKVQWGWLVTGTDDGACPSSAAEEPPIVCSSPQQANKSVMVCSPCLWFLPVNITCNFQNGRFIYELEGQDLLMMAANTPARRVFGGNDGGIGQDKETYFLDAVVALGRISQPPFTVEFLQLPESPDAANPDLAVPLQFHVQNNRGIIQAATYAENTGGVWTACLDGNNEVAPCALVLPSTDDVLLERGPLGVWDTCGLNPMAAIQSWLMRGVRAHSAFPERQGKGLTINYDSTARDGQAGCEEAGDDPNKVAHGKVIIWGNAFPTCQAENTIFGDRLKALYIVNGGTCSPVYSFTPNIKWNFTAAMSAGGTTTPGSGQQQTARENIRFNNCAIFGEGPRGQMVTHNDNMNNFGQQAGRETILSAAEHLRANYLHNSIEAELKVQGDPARWLCSPVFGYGRTVAILMINPFFLKDPNPDDEKDCPQFDNSLENIRVLGTGEEQTLIEYNSKCNEVLSNRNWFIKGADHQIRDGSYITTLKVFLLNPGSDFGGRSGDPDNNEPMTLSGDPASTDTFLCQQGTYTCVDKIVSSGNDLMPGMNTFCAEVCTTDKYVT